MLATAPIAFDSAKARRTTNKAPLKASRISASTLPSGQDIPEMLQLLKATLSPVRRVVHTGEVISRAGERFGKLYVLSLGSFKIVNLASDGREQLVGLKFRGDWLGFDGIATGRYSCDAIAMDVSEIWEVPYEELLTASVQNPDLLMLVHSAMSAEIARDHDTLMSVCTLPADARVAHFLHSWSDAMATRGLRADQITLSMTRAEIGSYLGMTLESVSRALSNLAKRNLICFDARDRRAIGIPGVEALARFVDDRLFPEGTPLQ